MLEYLQSCLRAAEMETAQAARAASPVQGLMSEREAAGEAHPQHRELQAANAQLEVRFLIIFSSFMSAPEEESAVHKGC
jgi:hypothetical protein